MSLHREISRIAVEYMIFQKKNNLAEIQKLLPQIQEFAVWFLESNCFGLDDASYEQLTHNLLCVLNDINLAFEHNDRVLLHDAVNYGFAFYLELFLPEQNEENLE